MEISGARASSPAGQRWLPDTSRGFLAGLRAALLTFLSDVGARRGIATSGLNPGVLWNPTPEPEAALGLQAMPARLGSLIAFILDLLLLFILHLMPPCLGSPPPSLALHLYRTGDSLCCS